MRCLGAVWWLALGADFSAYDSPCLPNAIEASKRRNFTVFDYNGPLKLYTMLWASGRVVTKVARTVFEEVFGYHVDDSAKGWSSQLPLYELSGCIKDKDCTKKEGHDIQNPGVHLGFEMWRVPPPPIAKENFPELYGTLEYMGEEGVYMQPATAKKFRDDKRIVTIYHGLNGEVYTDFANYLMPLRDLLAAGDATTCNNPSNTCWEDKTKPAGSTLADVGGLGRVYQMYTLVSAARKDVGETLVDYEYATGDSAADPCCYDTATSKMSKIGKGCGNVWVAPTSRGDPLGCIPIITSVDWGYFLVPQAAKFKWPVCYISANWGDYVYVGKTFNILSYWWTPDTTFTSMNFAEILVPKYNGLGKTKGDHTCKTQTKLDNLGWKFVRKGDGGKGQFIAKFGFNVALYDPDPEAWMKDVNSGMTNQQAACKWLKENDNRWRKWVPPMEPPCKVGQQQDPATGKCTDCVAGSYVSKTNQERILWECLTCDPGSAQPLGGADSCNGCKPGQFSAVAGATACSHCAAGSFQRSDGQSSCSECSPGTFAGKAGQEACEQCPVGTYQSEEGASGCVACKATFTTTQHGATDISACTCVQGEFWNREEDKCVPCQAGAVCGGGLEPPIVAPDRYGVYVGKVAKEHASSKRLGDFNGVAGAFSKLEVYGCRPDECMAEVGKCPPRRRGTACAICEPGYYLHGCEACQGGSFLLLIILIIASPCLLWSGCYAFDRQATAKAYFQMVSTLGIMVTFLQMLAVLRGFNMAWPLDTIAMFSIGRVFIFDFEGIGMGCIVGNGFAAQYYALLVVPALLAIIMALMVPTSAALPSIRLDTDRALNFLGMLYSSAFYLMLVKAVLGNLECVPNPAAPTTLAKYRQVVCNTGEHSQGTAGMVLGMIVYVVGIYVLCLYLNVTAPEKFENPKFRARCKFLVHRWRVDVWYWGTVYMTRSLLIAVPISAQPIDQCVTMVLLVAGFLTLTSVRTPWKDECLAQFDQGASFCVIMAVCFGVGVMNLLAEKEILAGATQNETTRQSLADTENRIATFTSLLFATLMVGVALFVTMFAYCVVNVVKREEHEKRDKLLHKLMVERYDVIRKHKNFSKQFDRYIGGGTSYDVRFLCAFMDNMQARLGGAGKLGPMSGDLEDAMKTSGELVNRAKGSTKGRAKFTAAEARVKLALAKVSFLQAEADDEQAQREVAVSEGGSLPVVCKEGENNKLL